MSEETEKRISIYVPVHLHKVAKTKAAAEGTSFQKLLYPYLEQWAQGKRDAAEQPPKTSQIDRWHQMLSEILESGDHEAISAVQQNILVFHRIVGAANSRIKKRA